MNGGAIPFFERKEYVYTFSLIIGEFIQ